MLREFGLPRYELHVLYGGHNAIPHNNVTILREVNSYSIPPLRRRDRIVGVTKLKNKVLNSYAAEPRVYRFQQCPCLHLCFSTACCHTAGRSLSRDRIHKILGSYAVSKRMNHLRRYVVIHLLDVLHQVCSGVPLLREFYTTIKVAPLPPKYRMLSELPGMVSQSSLYKLLI